MVPLGVFIPLVNQSFWWGLDMNGAMNCNWIVINHYMPTDIQPIKLDALFFML